MNRNCVRKAFLLPMKQDEALFSISTEPKSVEAFYDSFSSQFDFPSVSDLKSQRWITAGFYVTEDTGVRWNDNKCDRWLIRFVFRSAHLQRCHISSWGLSFCFLWTINFSVSFALFSAILNDHCCPPNSRSGCVGVQMFLSRIWIIFTSSIQNQSNLNFEKNWMSWVRIEQDPIRTLWPVLSFTNKRPLNAQQKTNTIAKMGCYYT